ncbi:MAG: hypothetical protein AAFU03_13285 [Bacteroidota bacterium]
MRSLNQLGIFLFLVAALTLLTFSSCNNEDTDPNESINNQLEGDWEVESFTIDGEERMNFTHNSFDMEFSKEGPASGEAQWNIIFTDGSTFNSEFDYEIENEGQEIDFDGDDFDIEIDGDDLELSGNVSGARWIIEAERD